MLGVAIACLPVFFTNRRIDCWEGWLFLAYYAGYTGFLILDATRSHLLPYYRAAMMWFVIPLTIVTLLVIALRRKPMPHPPETSSPPQPP
jgi:cation:H+ antiporter